ncbi:hypothetical protein ETAA8_19410 [Anatilimnocola aggregata]|uniref:Uncharacterized protein n=1 Tax=Anatilimnocola aggregata TaxID=2528021 RepID=A0A517Y9E4_9BACT|nr:hypothetical protein [Anatilimnocola aggregata]QDU26857.1 hypothetical protein ETAA8_19410 [Anatilimnocola aggregata]
MIHTHETGEWEEVAPAVQQRRHTLTMSPVTMEQALEFTGRINTDEYFGVQPGHLSIVKLTNREDHAVVIVLERTLHWCQQRQEDGTYQLQPESRECCNFAMVFEKQADLT